MIGKHQSTRIRGASARPNQRQRIDIWFAEIDDPAHAVHHDLYISDHALSLPTKHHVLVLCHQMATGLPRTDCVNEQPTDIDDDCQMR